MALTISDGQRYMVRFLHYEKALALMPGLSEGLLATLVGLSLDDYRAARAECADAARDAARDQLADPAFAASADRLPFAPGAVVVGLGDSITDDLLSWFEILRQLCDLRRPDDKIQFVNAGIYGETTSQMISRFFAVADRKPDWIICFAGTNDARRHGHQPHKTLVSPAETAENLAALRHFGATQTSAQWLWVTPATVVEEQIASDPFLSGRQVMWRNDDLRAAADAVRRQSGPIVDLQPIFGLPANPAYFIDDGLHPSLAGQKVIARAVVEKLSELG